MSDSERHLAHQDGKGVNPVFAVLGAIIIAAFLVLASYLVFNRSKSATTARDISKQHQQIRKEQAKSQTTQGTDSSTVTTDSLDKQNQQIDQTLRSSDLGSGQVQGDDLSDKGLGLQ